MALYTSRFHDNSIIDNLLERFKDLEIEITKREHEMDKTEAQIFYNDLLSLYDRVIKTEIQAGSFISNSAHLQDIYSKIRPCHLKVTQLKAKLAKISPSIIDSYPVTASNSNSQLLNQNQKQALLTKLLEPTKNGQSPQTAQIAARPKLDALIKTSESLIKRMTSMEPTDEMGTEKAEILYQHLTSLYHAFVLNQREIETQVSGATLDEQLEISSTTQQQVIEFQTKLKQIYSPKVPSSSMQFKKHSNASESDLESERANFDSELKTLSELCAKFNDLFLSLSDASPNKPNCSDANTTLNEHLEISKDIQSKMISLQMKMDDIRIKTDKLQQPLLNGTVWYPY